MSETPRPHRPALPGARHFEAMTDGADPAERSTAADRCATLLVRGTHGSEDEAVVARVVRLAETEGLDTLADLWSGSPAGSLAGCLWRLYLLRTWVYADPVAAAREFEAGRGQTPVHEVVAGVIDPPGPDEVRLLVDAVLRGVVHGDFEDTLWRAAAFARVVAAGRARVGATHAPTPYASDLSAAKLVTMAEQLEAAARLERSGELG
ncbi:hypothetical protein [Nocardioides mesophilus]|uniref:DNA-directed RNA polymerase subunit beta n=1 Tax=Nocardioides mesophilus TaxID=433659 RepID=A0A7G9RA09_9ACTN|nr:hypothetical protein [Nocardioides mesophilus]QNN52434.1 hypothetical protein H9L09_18470 [Nocardioides mesophilus]